MMRFAVDHPEVNETLYVTECVVRMPCPQCKVAAGTPCKGARFGWMERGERRGFRYVQDAHAARRELFRDWKQNGRPARIPASIVTAYEKLYAKFPKRIDRKSQMPSDAPRSCTRTVAPVRHVSRRPKKSDRGRRAAPRVEIEHRGCLWEGIAGNSMLMWHPYLDRGDYSAFYIFEYQGTHSLSTPGSHARHEYENQVEAFDAALDLVVRREFLRVLNARSAWRVQELERRFGEEL